MEFIRKMALAGRGDGGKTHRGEGVGTVFRGGSSSPPPGCSLGSVKSRRVYPATCRPCTNLAETCRWNFLAFCGQRDFRLEFCGIFWGTQKERLVLPCCHK